MLWSKRMETGKFRIPVKPAQDGPLRIELDRRALAMLLEGIDPKNVKKSRRFSLSALAPSAHVQ